MDFSEVIQMLRDVIEATEATIESVEQMGREDPDMADQDLIRGLRDAEADAARSLQAYQKLEREYGAM